MRRPVLTSLTVLGLLFTAVSPLLAQSNSRLGGREYRADGSGSVRFRGSNVGARRATLDLQRDGDFVLNLSGDRNVRIEGRWSDRNASQVNLSVREIDNRDARANGTASLGRNNQLGVVSIDGLAEGSRFSVDFRNTADRDEWNNRNRNRNRHNNENRGSSAIRSLDSNRTGSGEVRYGNGNRDRIRSVHVTLESDRDAIIRINGESDFTLRGRWTAQGNNRVTFDIQEGFGTERTEGSGYMTLENNRRSFDVLQLEGRGGRSNTRFNLSFRTGDHSNWNADNDDNWGDNDDRRAAGTYGFTQRFTRGGDRDSIRYTLRLMSGGRAELVAQTNEDLDRSRENIEDYGRILNQLDRNGVARHTGTWSVNGDKITIRLRTLISGNRPEGEESVFRGTFENNYRDLRIDEWDRTFYGSDTRFWFDRQ